MRMRKYRESYDDTINYELSNRVKDALKMKEKLFDFINDCKLKQIEGWVNFLKSKNVPFLVLHKGSVLTGRFSIWKKRIV